MGIDIHFLSPDKTNQGYTQFFSKLNSLPCGGGGLIFPVHQKETGLFTCPF